MSIDLLIYVISTKKLLTVDNILDAIVIFCLILSFSLYGLYKNFVYIQIVALIKLKDIFLINQMLYNMSNQYNFIYKSYVIIKIVYWIILVGHILGCLFYALDIYLIKIEYFGSIQ